MLAQKTSSPKHPRRRPPIGCSAEERFNFYVIRTEGCWEWTGYKSHWGYGRFGVNGKMTAAHRWSYERFVAPIPDGLVIDHLCRNPSCVNPAHLEPVTPTENTLRGIGPIGENLVKTHCKHGHEFSPENTSLTKQGHRRCRTCVRNRGKGKGQNAFLAACGSKGGAKTAASYGADHMAAIGKQGGEALKAAKGPDYYRQLGRKGGLRTNQLARQQAAPEA